MKRLHSYSIRAASLLAGLLLFVPTTRAYPVQPVVQDHSAASQATVAAGEQDRSRSRKRSTPSRSREDENRKRQEEQQRREQAEKARKAEEERRERARRAERDRQEREEKARKSRRAEQERREEEERRERARRAEQSRQAEQERARRAEQARRADQERARRAEQSRRAEQARKAEREREDRARRDEQSRRLEQAREAERRHQIEQRSRDTQRSRDSNRSGDPRLRGDGRSSIPSPETARRTQVLPNERSRDERTALPRSNGNQQVRVRAPLARDKQPENRRKGISASRYQDKRFARSREGSFDYRKNARSVQDFQSTGHISMRYGSDGGSYSSGRHAGSSYKGRHFGWAREDYIRNNYRLVDTTGYGKKRINRHYLIDYGGRYGRASDHYTGRNYHFYLTLVNNNFYVGASYSSWNRRYYGDGWDIHFGWNSGLYVPVSYRTSGTYYFEPCYAFSFTFNHGYEKGYLDGYARGVMDWNSYRPYNSWNSGSQGYYPALGSWYEFADGYSQGFSQGYLAGYTGRGYGWNNFGFGDFTSYPVIYDFDYDYLDRIEYEYADSGYYNDGYEYTDGYGYDDDYRYDDDYYRREE